MWSEVREEQVDRLCRSSPWSSSVSRTVLWRISEAGELRSPGLVLSASSHSPSVLLASSLELESGLVVRAGLLGPLEEGDGVAQHSLPDALCLVRDGDPILEQLFCSEEWDERDSKLPMGVLLGLLLNVSPDGEKGLGWHPNRWTNVCFWRHSLSASARHRVVEYRPLDLRDPEDMQMALLRRALARDWEWDWGCGRGTFGSGSWWNIWEKKTKWY